MSTTDWTYHMVIYNFTDETLNVDNFEKSWGIWYLNGHDDSKPISIGPNECKEVFGIRASKGTATGYQGCCTWVGKSGSIYISIEVPYSKDNKSSFKTTGMYDVEGWHDLPKRGHHFDHTLVIEKVY